MNRLATVRLAVLLLCMAATAAASEKPNIVFFLADDLGYMDVGANNPDTFYETPNIDRIARDGMRFTDGYAANPVCSPTRYSIMTGRYPTRAAATNFFSGTRAGRYRPAAFADRMPRQELTVAEALKSGGYRTAFLGKWHLGPSEEYWPEAQGFDINRGGFSAGSPPGGYFSPYKNPKLADGPPGEHLPMRLAEEARQIINQWQDGPFLVYCAFHSVHTPLQAPPELVEKYRRKAAAMPVESQFGQEEQVWPGDATRQVRIAQRHAVYAAMMESMDRAVGRVLAQLDELELNGKTAVFFTSDNGGLSTSEGLPTSNLPLRGGKGWLYEGGIRVPYLVKWPGTTQPGSVCRQPVLSTDIYPTMLAMAGLAARPAQHRDSASVDGASLDGASLVELLRGSARPVHDALFWHYPHYSNQGGFPGGAVRMGSYKLIERFEDGQVHLYDLAHDLGECRDLARQMPERVEQMRARLHQWYHDLGARFLEPLEGGPEPWRPAAQQ